MSYIADIRIKSKIYSLAALFSIFASVTGTCQSDHGDQSNSDHGEELHLENESM
jgi:hypothetical protein